MKITEKMLEKAKNHNGVYNKIQKRMVKKRFNKEVLDLLGCDVEQEFYQSLLQARVTPKQKRQAEIRRVERQKYKEEVARNRKNYLNSMSPNTGNDWSWNPQKKDIPELKPVKKKIKGRNKSNKMRITRLDNDQFYTSKEWRRLRVRVLEKYECKCMMCGRSPKDHSVVIHVDHIKPRSKYPELSLDIQNLQILCEDCNLGKSNRYETDWRPKTNEEYLDLEALKDSPL